MNNWKKTLPLVAAIVALPVISAIVLIALTWAVHLWDVPPGAFGCIALLLTFGGVYYVWRASRAFVDGRCRFRLRAFLIGISLVAIILGTVGQPVLKRLSQGYAARAVAQSGGYPGHGTEQHAHWLHAAVGYDPFDNIEVLSVRANQAITELLLNKAQFSDLEQLSFFGGPTDASLKHASEFNDFSQLHCGEFVGTPITDAGLKYLVSWTNVRYLFFNGCAFTDKGLAHLSSLPRLTYLTIIGDEFGGMAISDTGMLHIGNIPTLKNLRLIGVPVTDKGLASLTKLPNLERLTILRTAVTENGLERFRAALPDCWVTGMKDSFPTVAQIRQIRVCDTTASENEMTVIYDIDQIDHVKACLERLVPQTGVDWQNDDELKVDSTGAFIVHFEGTRRTLCSCLVGNQFLRNGWGGYRTLTGEESAAIRETLGIKSDKQ